MTEDSEERVTDCSERLYDLHIAYEDGSRTDESGLTCNDVVAYVGTLDNVRLRYCIIEPTYSGSRQDAAREE